MSYRGGRPVPLTAAVVAVLSLLLWLVAPPPPAVADTQITTPWPVVEVEPGSEVSVTLEVAATPRQRIDLEVVEVPDGWETLLRGGGFVIRAVTGGEPTDAADVDLEVNVPPDAAEGTYEVGVVASAADGTQDRLGLGFVVVQEVAASVSMETEFPELSGAADETFRWSLDLDNTLPGETTFALEAHGPTGWEVTARPSSESQATTVTLQGGDTETIEVRAEPPSNVEAGRYDLLVVASGGGQRLEVPLTAIVEGNVGVDVTTEDDRLNTSGSTGRATRVSLLVTNTGSATLTDLSMRADPPAGWDVRFEPEQPGPIAPGETVEVTAVITPADDAITGDYAVGISVEAEGRSDDLEVRFQVQTPLGWGAIGVTIIGVVIAALGYVFRRFGRR